MLPDIRFAIGAVLAGALLIVTAFGLAATVRIAHHKATGPLDGARMLAYADVADSGRRPDALRRLEELRGDAPASDALLERLAAIAPEPVNRIENRSAAAPEPPPAPAQIVLPTPIALP